MPSEVPRCVDCGAPLKAVPAWLATANVSFTCTSCPRRTARPSARLEPVSEPRAALVAEPEVELEAVDLDDLEEEADLEIAEEVDDLKEEKDL